MKTARWWSFAVSLLGLAVLGTNGGPNKQGFGSPPYRPVVRFRHKVLIAFLFHLLSITRRLFAFAKYEANYSGAFMLHQMILLWWLFFCPLEKYLMNHYPSLCAMRLSFERHQINVMHS